MRKSILLPHTEGNDAGWSEGWFPLDSIAIAEISSEDPQHPIEHALMQQSGGGWKAAVPGPQVIRFVFDSPQSIRRIRLQFKEERVERAQEFAVFASSEAKPREEVVRQQWMFSPGGSTAEVEDYSLNLANTKAIELVIDPGRHDKKVFATLESIQIG